MGRSLTATLLYGYLLGSDDGGWHIKEYDEESGFHADALPWLEVNNEGDIFDEEGDVIAFDKQLDDRRAVLDLPRNIAIESDGTGDWSRQFLVAGSLDNISQEEFTTGELHFILDQPSRDGWDQQLLDAIEKLGVHPTQEEPRWFLTASYG